MAPKRLTPFEHPPSASSSDEEEVTSDDKFVASDEEMEEEVPHAEEAAEQVEEEEEEEEEMAVNGEPADFQMDDIESTMNHLVCKVSGLSEEYLKRGLSLIEKTERVKMAKRWEKLVIDENKLMLKHLELHQEKVKLALDALRKCSH